MSVKKPVIGRPRVGQAISITLTETQLEWIDTQLLPGGSRAAFIRAVIHAAMVRGGEVRI